MADNQYLLPLPLQVDPKVAFPRKSQPKVSKLFFSSSTPFVNHLSRCFVVSLSLLCVNVLCGVV